MRDYMQMNELRARFPGQLEVLAFPCNQFGKQENLKNGEILASLRHVRPGNDYKPQFPLFDKCEVNGKSSHPLFKFLRLAQPFPSDRSLAEEEEEPAGAFKDSARITWAPITRTDITWNFEKFLIAQDGTVHKRYSPQFETIKIAADIEKLLQK